MASQGFAPSFYSSDGNGGLVIYIDAGYVNGVYYAPQLVSVPANQYAYPISAGSYQICQVNTIGINTSGTSQLAKNNPQFTTAQFNNAYQLTPGINSITDLRV